MSKPVVAVVGRPNVGKSTLFNVIAGERIAIVKDTPGVTRDRIYADASWLDRDFTLIDTGGIEPDSKDIILSQMREQAEVAIHTADVILFLTDVRQGLLDADAKVAELLRRSKKPVILVVNKVDNFDKFMPDVYEFYNLGIGDPHPISASSKLGLGDMLRGHGGGCRGPRLRLGPPPRRDLNGPAAGDGSVDVQRLRLCPLPSTTLWGGRKQLYRADERESKDAEASGDPLHHDHRPGGGGAVHHSQGHGAAVQGGGGALFRPAGIYLPGGAGDRRAGISEHNPFCGDG